MHAKERISYYIILVSVKRNPFVQAFALHPSGKNCSPGPYVALRKPIFPRVLFFGGMFFSQTPVWPRAKYCLVLGYRFWGSHPP